MMNRLVLGANGSLADALRAHHRLPIWVVLACVMYGCVATAVSETAVAPKPLFIDPHYHGSCDPEIFWNEATGEWLIFYTGRRATREQGDVAAACPIGVAASRNWLEWDFKGYCRFDGKDNRPDASHTYWAPAVAVEDNVLHMFVSFKPGTNGFLGGVGEGIRLYVAQPASPLDWRFSERSVAKPEAIDAGLLRQAGSWLMYYRDQDRSLPRGTTTWCAQSRDLRHWEKVGPAKGDVNDPKVTGFNYQEAQYPFVWQGSYWLLTDPNGPPVAAYRSDDAVNWKYVGNILDQPGRHPTDKSVGRHPSVAIIGKRAFIFYHVEPDRDYSTSYEKQLPGNRRCYLQVAELKLVDGRLLCDRDEPVEIPPFISRASMKRLVTPKAQ